MSAVTHCSYRYSSDDTERTCPRAVVADHDWCVFHLSPAQRREAGVSATALRSAFLADVEADDPDRRAYVDVHLDDLDLSALVVDGDDVGSITFRRVTVDGTLDLSGSVIKHPVVVEDCHVDRIDVTRASFEMDVSIEGTTVGGPSAPSTCFRARRGSFDRSLDVSDSRFDGGVEFAACRVQGWLDVDGVAIADGAHFPNLSVGTAQFVSTTFESGAEFTGATADTVIFNGAGANEGRLDLSEGSFGRLRVAPDGDLLVTLDGATVSAGRLEQPDEAVARYDLTTATVGDVDLDCGPDSFGRYRFFRTRFDGFPFASYREVLRANRWRIHEYVGRTDSEDSVEGVEHTYLEAKQGASESGDSETTSMFFLRELRCRRRRYASHASAREYSLAHRTDAALRWATNGFLDIVAGYGERPQRTAALALLVIVGSALVYPAIGGLTTGAEPVQYSTHGVAAVLDGLYFSAVTFATLGLGDVHPVSDAGRLLAASEGLAGALLTAIFVFSLGRRVTR